MSIRIEKIYKTMNNKLKQPHSSMSRNFFFSGANLIMSSILKIVIAGLIANLIESIFDIIGSKTPALKLFLGLPFTKSKPQYLRPIFF